MVNDGSNDYHVADAWSLISTTIGDKQYYPHFTEKEKET